MWEPDDRHRSVPSMSTHAFLAWSGGSTAEMVTMPKPWKRTHRDHAIGDRTTHRKERLLQGKQSQQSSLAPKNVCHKNQDIERTSLDSAWATSCWLETHGKKEILFT
jgi:hypothetical protein